MLHPRRTHQSERGHPRSGCPLECRRPTPRKSHFSTGLGFGSSCFGSSVSLARGFRGGSSGGGRQSLLRAEPLLVIVRSQLLRGVLALVLVLHLPLPPQVVGVRQGRLAGRGNLAVQSPADGQVEALFPLLLVHRPHRQHHLIPLLHVGQQVATRVRLPVADRAGDEQLVRGIPHRLLLPFDPHLNPLVRHVHHRGLDVLAINRVFARSRIPRRERPSLRQRRELLLRRGALGGVRRQGEEQDGERAAAQHGDTL